MPKQFRKRREPRPAIRVTVRFVDAVNGPARLTAALVEIGRSRLRPPAEPPTEQ